MIKKIKNNDTVTHTWLGQEVLSEELYQIQPLEEIAWANDDQLLIDISNSVAIVNDGNNDITSINDAINYLKSDIPKEVIIPTPTEVIPTTIKNEHAMQPWGCVADYFETTGNFEGQGDYVCSITLSNMSQDGKTFSYNSDLPITPAIGNYVFQRHNTRRSWITSFDLNAQTVTFEKPNLSNGTGIYCKGYYIDCLVEDWKPIMYLWGMTLTILEYDANGVLETDPCTDFLEFSIVDKNDLFKDDTFCSIVFSDYGVTTALQAVPYLLALGFEDNGEYGHWTKYYDESWALNCLGVYIATPDGSPGALVPGLYLRLSFFTTENELHKYKIFIDYYPTAKD